VKYIAERARLYRQIRDFFAARHVLEVDVPTVGRTAALDPNLEALQVVSGKQTYYLQTSPEYFHKRLLSAGSGSIYSLTRAYRQGEQGRLHNPEFAILEWYQVGFTMQDLIDETLSLLDGIKPDLSITQNSYAELFEEHLGINPHQVSTAEVNHLVEKHTSYRGELSLDSALELLFSQAVEPRLPTGIQVVTHYPSGQAAMARRIEDACGYSVALRFEIYLEGVELANGYEELTDPDEQRNRFEQEQKARSQRGQSIPEIDTKFLAALESGLPPCSGVALGVDRLLMLKEGASRLSDVVTFDWESL
jgi:lysyl-tRNA synthetase class 2